MGRTAPAFRPRYQDVASSLLLTQVLGVGGTATTGWIDTNGFSRVDCYFAPTAATTLVVEHSDDGINAIAGDTETWYATAGSTSRFPTPTLRHYIRFTETDTGGGGAVLAVLELDPRPVGDILSEEATRLFTGPGKVPNYTIPLGARSVTVLAAVNGGSYTQVAYVVKFEVTAGSALGPQHGMGLLGQGGPCMRLRIPSAWRRNMGIYTSGVAEELFTVTWHP
jgi:hypothetical protein